MQINVTRPRSGHWYPMRRIFRHGCRAAFLLWLVLHAAAAPAATFEDGVTAYNRGDHQAARTIWQGLAEKGDVNAQVNVGFMLEHGQGGPRDTAAAARWYRDAAERGNAAAQFNLGVMFYAGEGVPQDDAEAAKWYRQAAERGYARAQHNLGLLYELGRGVPQDFVQAYVWFGLAAASFGAKGRADGADAGGDRDKLKARMTPAQIVEAERLLKGFRARRR